jgi:hypothetical protein
MGLLLHAWMVQPIINKPLLPKRISASYETRKIEYNDPLLKTLQIRPEILISRIEQNALCLGAFKKDKLVSYIWLSFDTYEEDEARCTFILTPTEMSVFDFDLYVYPEARMGMAFAAIWEGANQYLYEKGVRFSYSRLDCFNLASARAHKHLGCKRIGGAIILKLWNWECMIANKAPWFSMSASTSKRVPIKLSPEVLELAN